MMDGKNRVFLYAVAAGSDLLAQYKVLIYKFIFFQVDILSSFPRFF
jgi:hypothetical protein